MRSQVMCQLGSEAPATTDWTEHATHVTTVLQDDGEMYDSIHTAGLL